MKKNIISVSGELASGKSTIIKILMESLNYTVYRNGEYFRIFTVWVKQVR